MRQDLSQIEAALRVNDRDIEAIDEEIKGLQGTISGMQNEIANLTKQKEICVDLGEHLKVRLGIIPPPEKPSQMVAVVVEEERDFVVPRNFVKGMGPADAALKILRHRRKPITHPELVQLLLKGKVRSESQNPDVAFRTAIGRRKEFIWIKLEGSRGVWVLREWPGYEKYESGKKVQKLEPTEVRPPLSLVSEKVQ